MTSLTELANRYGSDKGDQVGCCHRYASLYEEIFGPFREEPISLLEIGLQRAPCQDQPDCPSLRMWLDYFPRAEIAGFDLSDFSEVTLPRARIFQGDQSDAVRLTEVAEQAGPFDVIIDDGSHASEHQQITLGTLFPYVKPGGIFVIEDAHWQPERDIERCRGIRSMVEIFSHWVIYGKPIESPFIDVASCREIEQTIFRCTFSHPFVDPNSSRVSSRPQWRSFARRLLKGKKAPPDHRLFKLIVLEKLPLGCAPGCETVTAQMAHNAK